MLGIVSSRREGESVLDLKPDDARCRASNLAGDPSPSQVTGWRVPGGSEAPDAATTTTIEESVCSSAVKAVIDTDAPLVVAPAETGSTATRPMKSRFGATTLAASANGSETRWLPCVRGVVSATEVASSVGTDYVITEAADHAARAGIIKAGGRVIAVHERKDPGRLVGLLPINSDQDQSYFIGDVGDPVIRLDDYEEQYFGTKENVERAEQPRERESPVTAQGDFTRVSGDHCQFCDQVLRGYEFASCGNCGQVGCSRYCIRDGLCPNCVARQTPQISPADRFKIARRSPQRQGRQQDLKFSGDAITCCFSDATSDVIANVVRIELPATEDNRRDEDLPEDARIRTPGAGVGANPRVRDPHVDPDATAAADRTASGREPERPERRLEHYAMFMLPEPPRPDPSETLVRFLTAAPERPVPQSAPTAAPFPEF